MASGATEPVGWYISHQNGNSVGPLTDLQMRQAIGRGRIKPHDHVWRDGMEGWVEAREIPNFEEVRRAFRQEAQRSVREKQPRSERRQPPSSQPRRSFRTSSRTAAQPASASSTAQPHPNSDVSANRPAANFDVQEWLHKLGKGKPGSKLPADLDKKLGQAAAKIGKIPPAAIAFLVLGLFVTPLLPLFWFIAWRIWAKANR